MYQLWIWHSCTPRNKTAYMNNKYLAACIAIYIEVLQIVYLNMKLTLFNHLLDSLVVESWHQAREFPGSIPSQGPRHTKDDIKMVPGSSPV